VSLPAVLAAAPALPLHEAGKYVAGAYVVFVAVLLIYVGIMAMKLQRMGRELAELNTALEARARAREAEEAPR
jgi:hypothetical protein